MNALSRFRKKYFADPAYYKSILAIALPMVIQGLVTNTVNMLDNVMVGRIGTAEMSAVSIVNQFIFVINLTTFGGLAGASVYGTQFFGKKDFVGQRYTFRFRVLLIAVLAAAAMLIMNVFSDTLIGMFLGSDTTADLAVETLKYGKQYLSLMIWGFIPWGIGQVYATAVKECGETRMPMMASIYAIGVNLILNYSLIFGHFGMPRLGVRGAAIATIIAKIVEAAVIIVWTHLHPEKVPFIEGAYKGFYIPFRLTKKIIFKCLPLIVNEFLWSMSVTMVAQSLSVRGIEVVAARNIAVTLTNMFGIIYIQLGCAIGIIMGMKLGAGKLDEAKDDAPRMIMFSLIISAVIAVILIPLGFVFPEAYNTEPVVKELAVAFILIQALATPIFAYGNAVYFILRSGGRTGIVFLFDFIYCWCIQVPLAFVLSNFTALDVRSVMAIVIYSEILKVIAGFFLVRSGIWIHNIVDHALDE